MKPDLSIIEKLVKLVASNDIGELEVQYNRNQWVRVSKTAGSLSVQSVPTVAPTQQTTVTAPPVKQTAAEPIKDKPAEDVKKSRPSNLIAVKSPMIGTFYRAPSPDAPSYVEAGDVVKPGTVVCIVEAMKLMNEIEAETSGKIVEILVENATPVEYGQELFLIEPS